jgi:glycosyltransferase involved in cell wall biosynthesis
MTRPHILHVYKDYYPPVLGGIESTINLMARGTLDQYEVSVLACSGETSRREETIDGVRVVRAAEFGRFASAPFSPTFPLEVRRLAAVANLIHLHHPNPTGDIACLLARPKAPIVMTYHSDVVRQKHAMWIYGTIQERIMRRCKVIMPTSQNYLESSPWLQKHADRCIVLPLGVDLQRFAKTETVRSRAAEIRKQFSPPITIFVGRLRYYKGLDFLIRAMPKIPGTLLIIGSGPEAPRLQSLIRELNLIEHVHLIGELTDSEVVAHLYASDAFCMPSHLRSEAFGLSQVEAMACRLPVVSSRIPTGVPFVNEHEVTGFTVEPASPDALAAALNQLYNDEALRLRMGRAAQDRARKLFSADRMCGDLKEVYEHVIKACRAE